MRKTEEEFGEFIMMVDGVPTYCKIRTLKKETYGFWIPQIRSWFWPGEEDQDKLHKLFENTTTLTFDMSPIKLSRDMRDVTPDDELAVEERPATQEEQDDLEWF